MCIRPSTGGGVRGILENSAACASCLFVLAPTEWTRGCNFCCKLKARRKIIFGQSYCGNGKQKGDVYSDRIGISGYGLLDDARPWMITVDHSRDFSDPEKSGCKSSTPNVFFTPRVLPSIQSRVLGVSMLICRRTPPRTSHLAAAQRFQSHSPLVFLPQSG